MAAGAVVCGKCRSPLRWDESLSASWIADTDGVLGLYQACPRCRGEREKPNKYPPGQRVPRHPTRDDYLPICGLCREALYHGERTTLARITEEDCTAVGSETEPGAYEMCPRCLAEWRLVIAARLIGAGVILEGTLPSSLRGGMLL